MPVDALLILKLPSFLGEPFRLRAPELHPVFRSSRVPFGAGPGLSSLGKGNNLGHQPLLAANLAALARVVLAGATARR